MLCNKKMPRSVFCKINLMAQIWALLAFRIKFHNFRGSSNLYIIGTKSSSAPALLQYASTAIVRNDITQHLGQTNPYFKTYITWWIKLRQRKKTQLNHNRHNWQGTLAHVLLGLVTIMTPVTFTVVNVWFACFFSISKLLPLTPIFGHGGRCQSSDTLKPLLCSSWGHEHNAKINTTKECHFGCCVVVCHKGFPSLSQWQLLSFACIISNIREADGNWNSRNAPRLFTPTC